MWPFSANIADTEDVEVSVRSAVDPTGIRKRATSERRFIRHTGRYRVLLIHGFRTDEQKAYENFQKFRAKAREVSETFEADMFGFAWPGDQFTRNMLRYFKHNAENAEVAGLRLAELLRDELPYYTSNQKICLIAHSLGCYVVIEALRALQSMGVDYSDKVAVFLMAAAFPENLVEAKQSHEAALAMPWNSTCFYSPDDGVLRYWFQTGHHWQVADACGLNGAPKARIWSQSAQRKSGFDHADYWPDRNGRITHYIAKICGYSDLIQPDLERRTRLSARDLHTLPDLPGAPLGRR